MLPRWWARDSNLGLQDVSMFQICLAISKIFYVKMILLTRPLRYVFLLPPMPWIGQGGTVGTKKEQNMQQFFTFEITVGQPMASEVQVIFGES